MTIPYNVSDRELKKYLKEHFINSDEKDWLYLQSENIKLKYTDLNLLAKLTREILSVNFTKMNYLMNYLKTTAKLLTNLGFPIPWTLPTGVDVQQSYLDTDTVRLKPFSYEKNRFTLKINNSNFDEMRQIRSLCPI